jgi:ribosomal protein L39E
LEHSLYQLEGKKNSRVPHWIIEYIGECNLKNTKASHWLFSNII